MALSKSVLRLLGSAASPIGVFASCVVQLIKGLEPAHLRQVWREDNADRHPVSVEAQVSRDGVRYFRNELYSHDVFASGAASKSFVEGAL